MMTEKYPTWLTGHVKEWAEKRLPTVTLCSTTGNELLEVWYYGDLLTVKGEPQSYIVDGDAAPGLVAARDPESGEEFVIFDGGRHGYDNMSVSYTHLTCGLPLIASGASTRSSEIFFSFSVTLSGTFPVTLPLWSMGVGIKSKSSERCQPTE